MSEVQFQMSQLVNLAIGSPEIGAVNFNLLQKVLLEILKLSDLESAIVAISAEDAAKLEETYSIKPKTTVEEATIGEVTTARSSVRRSGHQCPIDAEKVDHLLEDMKQVKFDLEDLTTKLGNMAATTETVPFQELHTSKSNIDEMNEKIKNIEEQMEVLKDLDLGDDDDRTIGQRLVYLEKHMAVNSEQLENINNILDDKLKNIISRFSTMEKDMGVINEKLNIAETSSQLQKQTSRADLHVSSILEQSSTINSLVNQLSTMQQDLDKLSLQLSGVNEEQEQRQMVIDVLTEQIELLKMVKADKINMEDVLAAKADLSQVHRKVSHDHFETKMVNLSSLLNDAFHRLDTHEELWQEEVEYIKTDIENKLDRAEFSPMKDYINERLKLLQEKMKALLNQKREGVAAGTKKRLIKDVQCISCDNDSVMKPEINFDDMTPPPSLPVHQSVKPYLTYELDKVRKQQKRLPGKNMLHLEEMMKEGKDGKELKQISSKTSRIPTEAFDKLTREGKEALSKGFTIIEHVFGLTNQPMQNVDEKLMQGREAYLKGLQMLSKAFRLPGINMHNVEYVLKECRDPFAKGHKIIENSSRPPDNVIMSLNEMLKEGQRMFDTCLSSPGFNMQNLDQLMEQFHRTFEKGLKIDSAMRLPEAMSKVTSYGSRLPEAMSKATSYASRLPEAMSKATSYASRFMDENVQNIGERTVKVKEGGGYPTDSGDEVFVKRYVGGSHTKTTAQQRVSRVGNFHETWGPIITAVARPEKSEA